MLRKDMNFPISTSFYCLLDLIPKLLLLNVVRHSRTSFFLRQWLSAADAVQQTNFLMILCSDSVMERQQLKIRVIERRMITDQPFPMHKKSSFWPIMHCQLSNNILLVRSMHQRTTDWASQQQTNVREPVCHDRAGRFELCPVNIENGMMEWMMSLVSDKIQMNKWGTRYDVYTESGLCARRSTHNGVYFRGHY